MAIFTTQHYEVLANYWREKFETMSTDSPHLLIEVQNGIRTASVCLYNDLCRELSKDNPNFDKDKFDAASGYTEQVAGWRIGLYQGR